ncbi:hypothetical protein OV079_21680 [Nannocystis pusilla]|uniref:Uncharacterized protein n=1 Tax=Nannocystis pusilla TaxID=889268 RepID=A0A9X3EPW9_9BACT|nr:hypothetical protein [Nannocystis pusilla]MCY1008119.1 hypothetical protein [Nannocystis pusilla]
MSEKTKPVVEGVKEIDPSNIRDLFQLETLAPPSEANGMSCCVIICWTKVPGRPS